MTFPQSPVPPNRQTIWSVVSMYEANKPYDTPWVVYATRFPILRSAPLWEQTWVDGRGVSTSGYWFPPLRCVAGWKLRRAFPCKWIWDSPVGGFQYRLYSSPHCRCATCLENAQTVELMLVGFESIGRADAWPDEHRCWFGNPEQGYGDCTGGAPYTLSGHGWCAEAMVAVGDWAWKNRCTNGAAFDMEPTGGADVPVGYSTCVYGWTDEAAELSDGQIGDLLNSLLRSPSRTCSKHSVHW